MTKSSTEAMRMTARDVLISVGGERHALHTVMSKSRVKWVLSIKCSCGESFEVTATEQNTAGLRNVAEVAS